MIIRAYIFIYKYIYNLEFYIFSYRIECSFLQICLSLLLGSVFPAAKRYCAMLVEEQGIGLLEKLLESTEHVTVKKICAKILSIVEQDAGVHCHQKQSQPPQQVIA